MDRTRAWSQSRESTLPLLWEFTLSEIGDYAGQLRLRVIVEETRRFLCTSETGIGSGLSRP